MMFALNSAGYPRGILVLFVIGLTGVSHAEPATDAKVRYAIPPGQEKVVRQMLTVPVELMKAKDCGAKNIKIERTQIVHAFRCAQSGPKPHVWPVSLRHPTAALPSKGQLVRRTVQFTLVFHPEMDLKLTQVIEEQVRRYEADFEWRELQ